MIGNIKKTHHVPQPGFIMSAISKPPYAFLVYNMTIKTFSCIFVCEN